MTVSSSKSFTATTAALKKQASQAGLTVLGDLNHAKILSRRTGLRIQDAHAYFAGDPAMTERSFRIDRAAGAAMPPRIYVWKTDNGDTKIGYFDPAPLITAINPKLAEVGKQTATKLAGVVSGAA